MISTRNLLGAKLFKYTSDDDVKVVRIISVVKNSYIVTIKEEDTGKQIKTNLNDLKKEGYTRLEEVGILTFSIVRIGNLRDIVVTFFKSIDAKLGINAPCAVCRQSVTDFFYTIISKTGAHNMVGVSCTADNCPSNIPYEQLLACDEIIDSWSVNYYYDDNYDTVRECINEFKINGVLGDLYRDFIKHYNYPPMPYNEVHNGWCQNLRTLIVSNNFWYDLDSTLNIIDVDFKISEYLVVKKDSMDQEYESLNDEAMNFFKDTLQINIKDTIVIEYGYDINLVDFNNKNFMVVRSIDNKIYVITYIAEGMYLKPDLQAERMEVAEKLGLKFHNKYN